MSKPRVFVSSTYFDLRHIRRGIEEFIELLGYDAVLFESGDIPFTHLDSLDHSCYREIEACHILVLIIGGRYGSQISGDKGLDPDIREKAVIEYNSITKKEYETAREKDIPIYIFLEKGVANEYRTYKENKGNKTIKYAHVDSVNIFKLLEDIYFQKRNNLTHEFENLEDITRWLRDQWAGLFGFLLARQSSESQLTSLQSQLSQLKETADVLKTYTESIMLGTAKPDSEKLIKEMEQKLTQQKINRVVSILPISHLKKYMIDPPSDEKIYQAVLESKNAKEFVSNFLFTDPIEQFKTNEMPQRISDDYSRLKHHLQTDTLESISDIPRFVRPEVIIPPSTMQREIDEQIEPDSNPMIKKKLSSAKPKK
jgi:hypothetical protein